MIKKCAWCRQYFKPEHWGTKYCSDECRKNASRKKQTQYSKDYYWKNREKVLKYKKSFRKKKKPIVTKICPVCGKKFETTKSNKKYCSSNCYDKFYRRGISKSLKKFPCYRFSMYQISRIPDELCFNCSAERCRFDNDPTRKTT